MPAFFLPPNRRVSLRILEASELAAVSGGGIKPGITFTTSKRQALDRGLRKNPNTTRR